MKNINIWKIFGLLAVIMFIASACTTVGSQSVDLGSGDKADVVWKTSLFGTDGLGIRFKSKAPDDPDILRLQSYESERETVQSYDQKCPNWNQLKNIKTTTKNREKTSYQDVANPNKRQDQIGVIGGTNKSVGNELPAAIGQGVQGVLAPATKISTTAIGTGGKGTGGNATGGAGGAGGAGGSASSSSASSASAAAAAAAGN